VTIVTCINATVTYVSLLMVFPRSNMNAELFDSPPPGSIAPCHKAGCIQKDSFMQRFKYFVHFMKTSTQDPVIMTLDGHYSHSRNIEVKDCTRENGVHSVCPPLHSTHKLLTLGVSFI
jgi:hypothetical protein